VDRRDEVRAALLEAGVASGIHYPLPIHLQPAYADLGYKEGAFPVAEKAAREVLSLPMYPELREEDVVKVAEAVRSAATPPRDH